MNILVQLVWEQQFQRSCAKLCSLSTERSAKLASLYLSLVLTTTAWSPRPSSKTSASLALFFLSST